MNDQLRFGRGQNSGKVTGDPVAASNGERPLPQSAGQAIKPGPGVTAPQKKRAKTARNQIIVFFNFMFSVFVFCLVVLAGIFLYGRSEFQGAGPLAQSTNFTVRDGASVGQVATSLQRNNIITDQRIFEWGVRANGNGGAIKAGEYQIEANASMQQVMDTLVSGRAILHPLTVVEGTTVFQAMQRIEANEILEGDMPTEMPAEGTLIADTQRFARGTTRSEIIDRMVAQQKTLVEQIWAKRASDLPIENIDEFMALASIVEKETGVAEERPQVAAVFINRLRKGMRLQSDPTIIYGIFGGEGKPSDRPIYRSDIDGKTPYNTYQIDGIPPGPIAIPGRASLEAVANPAQTDDLFFVADGTGGHVFAKTLDEHNANVAKWRAIEKQRAADAQANGN